MPDPRSTWTMPHTRPSPTLDRLLAWSLAHPLPPVAGYAVAAVLVFTIGLVRALLVTALVPWLLFVPAVLLIGLMLGRNPGIFASLLSAVVAGISIADPHVPGWLTAHQWIATALFLLTVLPMALLAAELRGAFARAGRLTAERSDAINRLVERESFLAGVLGSSTDCIKVLDLDGRLTFMSEGGKKVMEVSDFNAIAGCPWPDFWAGVGNAEAVAAIAAARLGRSSSFMGPAETMAGNPRWWHVAVSPMPGPDGQPERILSVSRDITALREAEEERGQLARIVENSSDFIGMARLDGTVFFLNDAACRLVGLPRSRVGTVSITDFFPPEEARIVAEQVLPAVVATGAWVGERQFRHFETGEIIPILYSVFPVLDGDGTQIGYGTVTRDFRERKRAEEQQQLLNHELSHRLKNVLAVVQSVAAQTLRQADDLPSANTALSARLAALGEATNVLTASSWAAADLLDVIGKALAPHGAIGERLRVDGPAFTLNPQVALAFALALHELATNAAKYGALSNDAGHVELSWTIPAGAFPDDRRFVFMWQEVGGPQVSPPNRRGFGSMMIERSLRAYFRGEATLDYRPEGLIFTLDAPLNDAGALSE